MNIRLLIVPSGRPSRLGELGLREAAVVGELDRLALVGRELAQRLLDDLALRAQPRLLVGRLARGLVDVVERVGAAALLAADEVDRAAVDERQDPGARLALLGEERAGRAPDGEERLLHRVLGERAVAHDPQREPVGDAAVAVVELAERGSSARETSASSASSERWARFRAGVCGLGLSAE